MESMSTETYEEYLQRTLSWIERVTAIFSGLDERIDYLNKTMLRIEELLAGVAPVPVPSDKTDVIVTKLDSIVTIIKTLVPGLEIPEYSHIPVFWSRASGGSKSKLIAGPVGTSRGQNWETDVWAGYELNIIEGTGRGQIRTIKSNTRDALIPASDFATDPDDTSVYVIRRFNPWAIEKANKHNASVTANTNILPDDLTPSRPPCVFRVMISSGAAVFSAIITKDTTSKTAKFHSGASLAVDCLYIFDMLVSDGDSVNFQLDTSVTLDVLRVYEIPSTMA